MRELDDTAGLMGVHGHPRAAALVGRGLRALRARGGDAAGVVVVGERVRSRREGSLGFLSDEACLEALGGDLALGQIHRMDTRSDASSAVSDPLRLPRLARLAEGSVTLAMSGAMLEREALQRELLTSGAAMTSDVADEVLLHLVARSAQRTMVNRLVDALWRVRGGYAVLLAAPGLLVGVRDALGLRPLVLGQVDGATVFASDGMAITAAGGHVVRALDPGEMVIVDHQGTVAVRPFSPQQPTPCIQEVVQVASPATPVGRGTAWHVRTRLGEATARAHAVDADLVVAADAASAGAAEGFGQVAHLPVRAAWTSGQRGEDHPIEAVPDVVSGRRVVLVALAGGPGIRPAIAALHAAGALDVHLRAVSPRRTRACTYGLQGAAPVSGEVDERFAVRHGLSSAAWLSLEDLREVLTTEGLAGGAACAACVGGAPPLKATVDAAEQLRLFEPGS